MSPRHWLSDYFDVPTPIFDMTRVEDDSSDAEAQTGALIETLLRARLNGDVTYTLEDEDEDDELDDDDKRLTRGVDDAVGIEVQVARALVLQPSQDGERLRQSFSCLQVAAPKGPSVPAAPTRGAPACERAAAQPAGRRESMKGKPQEQARSGRRLSQPEVLPAPKQGVEMVAPQAPCTGQPPTQQQSPPAEHTHKRRGSTTCEGARSQSRARRGSVKV